jgi:hypothetical protein
MAKTKYGKYILEYDAKLWPKEVRPVMSRVENSVMPGSNFYLIHWVMPGFEIPLGMHKFAGHPPHIHKDAELLFHIGTDPQHPMELGAEVEMYLGKELERHVITRTCCIYIPPNFIHAPWRPLKTTKPWIFIEINQGPLHTEKFYPQLLPKEAREKTDWTKWQDENME